MFGATFFILYMLRQTLKIGLNLKRWVLNQCREAVPGQTARRTFRLFFFCFNANFRFKTVSLRANLAPSCVNFVFVHSPKFCIVTSVKSGVHTIISFHVVLTFCPHDLLRGSADSLEFSALLGYNQGGRGKAPGSPLPYRGWDSGPCESTAILFLFGFCLADQLRRFFHRPGLRFDQLGQRFQESVVMKNMD